jgi:thiol-disulfide isomerase/thioredoxin|tara:strand:- start:639 stop:1214 length:576 start_codon:yes stop_codon:yes gene_type:complete
MAVLSIAVLIIAWGVFYFYPSGTINSIVAPANSGELENLLKTFGFYEPTFTPQLAEIVLFDLNQKPVKLTDYKGAIVFLNFWATWCPPCREEMPSMQKLYNRYKTEPFKMIAVSLKESPETVEDFFKENRLSFSALLDPWGEAGKKFGLNSIPTTFILDKNGNIIARALGPRDWGGRISQTIFHHLVKISS